MGWCCCAIVELCLSVIMNIVLLLLLLLRKDDYTGQIGQIGSFNFILISTNTILVSLELYSFCGKSIKKWNLVMRKIWTVVVGLIVTLYLIQLISCAISGRKTCLIWSGIGLPTQGSGSDAFVSVIIFSICLLIVGPMFFYGIFKSNLLSKILKSQSELPQQLPLTEL
jgi:hypothetical protein